MFCPKRGKTIAKPNYRIESRYLLENLQNKDNNYVKLSFKELIY